MGKYDKFFPTSLLNTTVTVEVATLSALVKIANELAEANRLKRIELLHAENSLTTDDEA